MMAEMIGKRGQKVPLKSRRNGSNARKKHSRRGKSFNVTVRG